MRRLHELDAIRGIAALVVALHHLMKQYGAPGLGIFPALAVDLFFALSGYVMARTYELRLNDGSLSIRGFVALRYRRLFLPLAIGTTIGLTFFLFDEGYSPRLIPAFGLALLFLPAFWAVIAFPFNIPAWSLFLEIIANAIHAAVFAKLSNRILIWLLTGCAVATGLLLANGYAHWDYGIVPIISCLPRELVFYLAGVLICRRFGDIGQSKREWMLWLGALSYPLYATHVPVIEWSATLGAGPGTSLAIVLTFAALVTWVDSKWRMIRNARHVSRLASA